MRWDEKIFSNAQCTLEYIQYTTFYDQKVE